MPLFCRPDGLFLGLFHFISLHGDVIGYSIDSAPKSISEFIFYVFIFIWLQQVLCCISNRSCVDQDSLSFQEGGIITSGASSLPYLKDSIDEDTLHRFCFGEDRDFSKCGRLCHLMSPTTTQQHTQNVSELLHRTNMFRVDTSVGHSPEGDGIGLNPSSYAGMPLVYDTGASFGLTPFRADFIDYRPCNIPVKDITKVNKVKGVGTVMYKFVATNGDILFLPGLSYHLDTADIRLFSPQTYHQLYGGEDEIDGERVIMHLQQQPHLDIRHDICIPIDIKNTNLPLIQNTCCNDEEKSRIGPHFRTAIAASLHNFGVTRGASVFDEFEFEFNAFADLLCPCVGVESNQNLSAGQKELLLWHWKLGISMHRVQELMKGHKAVDPFNKTTFFQPVITPRHPSAATCPVPACEICSIANAKRRSPQVVRQEAVKEKEAILAWNRYEAGDFVSMDQFVVRTPGRRLHSSGKESDSDKYHGGTIFNDAATGLIWIEHQVSLGAGETLLAKESFEQWLFDNGGVTIKHVHSDNGVFSADVFVDDCKKKVQKQSFSGVGAQHQNAKAERAIQTIMWMARSFMLHVSLHWTERGVDDVSLWSFAVKHAAWIYNRLPNRVSGLTPLELLTKTKADHRDLLRTHVWGCPAYVLDPSLQNNVKIPKWNQRARLAQFVGFSEQHSSLIANIRHLGTGRISPQYHVVFDDLFQTVFSDGINDKVTDAICDHLFEESRDVYVEPEYNEDGVLVYSPPPLDEIWLTEPERRDREQRLRDQRIRNEQILRERERNWRSSSPPPPPLERSSSPVFDPDDEDVIVSPPSMPVREPEGDGKDDIPDDKDNLPDLAASDVDDVEDVIIETEVSVSEEDNKSSRAKDSPSWERNNGRLIRKENLAGRLATVRNANASIVQKAKIMYNLTVQDLSYLQDSERTQYSLTFGAKDPPPTARRLSQKKVSHRQQRRLLQTIGDMLLFGVEDNVFGVEDNIMSIEKLTSDSFSKLVHLSANDCKYTGSEIELICSWVHPLFLKVKAEASRADNPNWREAMNGPLADGWWEACRIEIATLEGMDAWTVVDKTPDKKVLPSTWAFKIKRYPDGLVKKLKARFCARGDQQVEGIDFFETYAPVVQWTTIRTMLILEVLLGLKSKQGDVTAAFLHGRLEENEEIYLEMPRGFKQEGKCLKLNSTIYGLRQSPRAFWKFMVEKMESCGMKQSSLDPCLFVSQKVVAITWVDDILFWAKDEKDIHKLAMNLRGVGVDLEEEEDAAGFLGVTLSKLKDGRIEMVQTGLIDRIIEALGLDDSNAHGKWTPCEKAPLVRDENGEPAKGDFSYSSVVGMLLYLTGNTRSELSYAVNCSARYMFAPKASHEHALKRIGRYLKATRGKGTILNPSGNVMNIDCYPDADFAGMYGHESNTDPACVKSRTGYVITAANCPVHWQSKLQSETALSTMEAEIIALAHSCRELFPIMDLVKELSLTFNLPDPTTSMLVSIHEDNAGALVLAETLPPQFTPRSKHYATKTIWFREEIVKRKIKLVKIETSEQLGDLFTKALAKVAFEYLRKKLLGW